MEKAFIESQKKRLEELKEKLEKQLKSFAKKDEEVKDNWKSKFPLFDVAESGSSQLEIAQDEVEEYLSRLPLEHVLELRLRDINSALERIGINRYGRCEECKAEIPRERLNIHPEAKICLNCQKRSRE